MSTPNIPIIVKYKGNGEATKFGITFPYLEKKSVKVYLRRLDGTEGILDENRFTFEDDTTIVFPVLEGDEILQEGEVLAILRETELGSNFEFDNQRRLFPVEVMNADDRSFYQIQELAYHLERAVKTPVTSQQTAEELMQSLFDSEKSAKESAIKVENNANIALSQSAIISTFIDEARGYMNDEGYIVVKDDMLLGDESKIRIVANNIDDVHLAVDAAERAEVAAEKAEAANYRVIIRDWSVE